MENQHECYLAADLGASSGRLVAGQFDGAELKLEEVHRFANGGIEIGGNLHWNLLELWNQLLQGLGTAAASDASSVVSLGVDTWGVDFGLLDRNDQLIANPRHYRNQSSEILDQAFEIVPRGEIFEQTGLQFMEFNTLYQLLSLQQENSPLLDIADSLLMIPDLFHWMLSGEKVNEYTNATTTQMLDPRSSSWSESLLNSFNLPAHILQPVTAPGTTLGPLRKSLADSTGLANLQVVLPGSHDTASAVMAVPVETETLARGDWCYISSGTWSLMGAEIPAPVINDTCQQLNFTNEGGVGGTVRLLKNIAGLWLLQQCRAAWSSQQDYSWDQLVELANQSPPLQSLVDPDDPRFVAPPDMPAEIQDFCQQTGQAAPSSEGAIVRCVLESLALRYRQVLASLEQLCGQTLQTIHIVGGGSQNEMLCQMTADACNRQVIAGPVEATAIGNLGMQLVARGAVGSIGQAREVVRTSFPVQRYEPAATSAWDDAASRLDKILAERA
jgi:rhamnulokinase